MNLAISFSQVEVVGKEHTSVDVRTRDIYSKLNAVSTSESKKTQKTQLLSKWTRAILFFFL